MENEPNWLKLPEFPKYSVSDTGLVRNDRTGRILKEAYDLAGYAILTPFNEGTGCTRTVHRLVASAFMPRTDDALVIDHIDRDKRNNHVSNLRWVTKQQNMFNRTKQKRAAFSKHIGVSFDVSRGKWLGRVMLDGKHRFLGRFNTEDEALIEVVKARAEMHIIT